MIFFNHEPITAAVLRNVFARRGYHQLFSNRTKLYFDGCNVADGNDGWDFLAAAGEAFLRNRGGIAHGLDIAGGRLTRVVSVYRRPHRPFWGGLQIY